jgi:hypothetical protein
MLPPNSGSRKSGSSGNRVSIQAMPRVTRLLSRRALPVTWLLVAGQMALATRRHLQKLAPHERRRLAEIVRNSKGRPSNVSKRERDELRRLVRKLELGRLGRDVAGIATGARRGRR